jgi:hypothetical protein
VVSKRAVEIERGTFSIKEVRTANLVDKTARDLDYLTPENILDRVQVYFSGSIDLDPAAEETNHTKAERFILPDEDGLSVQWDGNTFLNPPFGRGIRNWVRKVHGEAKRGTPIVALLPGQRFEQAYWQEDVFNHHLVGFCAIRKRVSFLRPDGRVAKGNPYGSFVFSYNGAGWRRFREAFRPLGMCILPAEIAHHEQITSATGSFE